MQLGTEKMQGHSGGGMGNGMRFGQVTMLRGKMGFLENTFSFYGN